MLPMSRSKVSPKREGSKSGSARLPVVDANLRMVGLPCSDLANCLVLCSFSSAVISRSMVIGAAPLRRRRASRGHLDAERSGQDVDQKQGHERENYGLVDRVAHGSRPAADGKAFVAGDQAG